MNNQAIENLVQESISRKMEIFNSMKFNDESYFNTVIEKMNDEEKEKYLNSLYVEYGEKEKSITIEFNKQLNQLFGISNKEEENEHDEVLYEWRSTVRKAIDSAFENFYKFDWVMKVNEARIERVNAEQREKDLHIEVDGKSFKAIDVVDVYWTGWECDNRAWVVIDDGVKKLVTSNHGYKSFTDISFLQDKIKEYEEAIASHQRMLKMFEH